ncbi:MAG: DNA repair protein RecN [Spirochaetia bacterium]|nr:DNA repair protein RecN [Spirochaetales bacterium]MCF7944596.1 DNA repair protein RecN [Spirochaetia bacterium]
MIEELHVSDYALIEQAQVVFSPGLNILSGETGAGKSILIGALTVLFGGRARIDAIRTGSEEAVVSGTVRVDENKDALQWLEEHDIHPENGRVLIRRIVKRSGRGSIYIQSIPATRSELDQFSRYLIDFHGQHEHQSLLDGENHRRVLDQYGDLTDEVSALQGRVRELADLRKRLNALKKSEDQRLRELDYYRFAIDEIDKAGIQAGEEEELDQERRMLSQYEKLYSHLETVGRNLSEGGEGGLSQVHSAGHELEAASSIVEELAPLHKRLESAYYELEDIRESVVDYRNSLQYNPRRLEEIEDRLSQLRRLAKKYGGSVDAVIEYREQAEQEIASLESYESDREDLEKRIEELEREVLREAGEISKKRNDYARKLQRLITDNLKGLGMPQADFEISMTRRLSEAGKPVCGPTGIDVVAFQISPNAGEPLKPLKVIASGGEISRVMLAIKSVLMEKDPISTMVFDEIDAGIGGQIASSVGKHLSRLSSAKQVLCITHLATIASHADNHLMVTKETKKERTCTEVKPVAGDEQVLEVSRMLSGEEGGDASLEHARRMLEGAERD